MDGYHRHAAVSGDGRVLVAGAGVCGFGSGWHEAHFSNFELAELEAASLLLEEKTLERNKLLEALKDFRQSCGE